MPDAISAELRGRLARQLAEGLTALDIDLDQSRQDKLLELVTLLVKWNRVYNLTAVRDPADMIARHLLDSLVLAPFIVDTHKRPGAAPDAGSGVGTEMDTHKYDVIDIGTGAGFPVLPLAILRPDLSFLSIESNGKKTRFQQQAILNVGVPNVCVINERAEQVEATAAFVTSRAFTAPAEFLWVSKRFCPPGGRVAIMLGQADLMPAVPEGPFEVEQTVNIAVPGVDAPRHVSVCRRL